MVDMVNEKMSRGIHYETVHLHFSACYYAASVECTEAGGGRPCEFGQPVIIISVNESEFAFCKGYSPDGFGAGLKISARIEIRARLFEKDYPRPADEVGPLFAGKGRPVRTHHPNRKKTVITTNMS